MRRLVTPRRHAAIHLRSHPGERLNYYATTAASLFVLPNEIPVCVHLTSRFFPIRFDEHLVIPLTVGIVFPYYFHNLFPCRLLINCLLDG